MCGFQEIYVAKKKKKKKGGGAIWEIHLVFSFFLQKNNP